MTREVTLTTNEYKKMQRDIAKLEALESAGVDNWDFYDDALEGWCKENELDELVDGLASELGELIHELSCDAEVDYVGGPGCGRQVNIKFDNEDLEDFIRLVIYKYEGLNK